MEVSFVTKVLIWTAIVLAAMGCTRPRTWTTPIEKHLYYEVETHPNVNSRIFTEIQNTDGTVLVTVTEENLCAEVQYDVRRLTLKKEVRYPGKEYHIYTGTLISLLGIPTLYLGLFRSSGQAQVIQLGVSFTLFLAPGGFLLGQGIWEKNHEGVSYKNMGKVRHRLGQKEYPCGRKPVSSRRVEILTRTGYVYIGKTDARGTISFRLERFTPLERDGMKYVEIWVNGRMAQRIVVSKPEESHENQDNQR